MNFVNKLLLRTLTLPGGFYSRMGVDLAQLKAIVSTKLLMDDRRPGSLYQARRRNSSKPVSYATIFTMLLSALMGLIYLLAFRIGNDITSQFTIYCSLFFFMLSATLIADFTSVLIDVRDNQIILPKPVNDRTVVTARLLHIFIHICKIVIPMSIPGLVYMFSHYGLGGSLALVIPVVLTTLFSIFFINAVYLLILKFTTPAKFQSIISYVQIGFAVIMYGSYTVVPRMLDTTAFAEFNIRNYKAALFFPVYWIASTWKAAYSFSGDAQDWILAFTGLIVPILSIYLVVKFLAPAFNSKLALISGSETDGQSPARGVSRSGYADWLSRWTTRVGAERMGFLFTWKMSSRSRDFKIKVYPTIGYLLVYFALVFVKDHRFSTDALEDAQVQRVMVLAVIYFSSILLTMSISQAVFSDQFKASWFFYTTPLSQPGEVILGSAKASILRFFLPIALLALIAGISFGGFAMLPNLVLGFCNEILISLCLVYISKRNFPFSQPQLTKVRAGSFLRNLSMLVISGCVAIGHYLIYAFLPAVVLCLFLSAGACIFLMQSIRRLSYSNIT